MTHQFKPMFEKEAPTYKRGPLEPGKAQQIAANALNKLDESGAPSVADTLRRIHARAKRAGTPTGAHGASEEIRKAA